MAKKKSKQNEPEPQEEEDEEEEDDTEEEELELLQVELGDMIKMKQVLDEAVTAAILEHVEEE